MWHQVNRTIVSIVPKRWPSRASVSGRSSPGGPAHGAGAFGRFWTKSGGRGIEAGESPGAFMAPGRSLPPAVRAVSGVGIGAVPTNPI